MVSLIKKIVLVVLVFFCCIEGISQKCTEVLSSFCNSKTAVDSIFFTKDLKLVLLGVTLDENYNEVFDIFNEKKSFSEYNSIALSMPVGVNLIINDWIKHSNKNIDDLTKDLGNYRLRDDEKRILKTLKHIHQRKSFKIYTIDMEYSLIRSKTCLIEILSKRKNNLSTTYSLLYTQLTNHKQSKSEFEHVGLFKEVLNGYLNGIYSDDGSLQEYYNVFKFLMESVKYNSLVTNIKFSNQFREDIMSLYILDLLNSESCKLIGLLGVYQIDSSLEGIKYTSKETVVSIQLNASKYRNKIKYMYLLKRSNKSRVNLIHNSLFSECKSEVGKLLEQIDSSTIFFLDRAATFLKTSLVYDYILYY